MTIFTRTSSVPGGVPALTSSDASDIVKQPACAAASSSSGDVFPSGLAILEARVNGSSVNAPLSAVSVPLPRATFPSQTTSADRSILGISLLVGDDGGGAVGVIGLGGRARRTEDAEQAQLLGAGVREAVHHPRGQVHARTRPERRLLAVGVQDALAVEVVDHLVV